MLFLTFLCKYSPLVWLTVPIATPRNVWGEDHNSSALNVYWDPVENTREMIRGKIIGYQVNMLTLYKYIIIIITLSSIAPSAHLKCSKREMLSKLGKVNSHGMQHREM